MNYLSKTKQTMIKPHAEVCWLASFFSQLSLISLKGEGKEGNVISRFKE